ncbi:MAG: hypothetical protein WC860_09070, partial [Candidatus Margulisiibacteriota bacterium]
MSESKISASSALPPKPAATTSVGGTPSPSLPPPAVGSALNPLLPPQIAASFSASAVTGPVQTPQARINQSLEEARASVNRLLSPSFELQTIK